jgi:hypothetical protein
MRSTCNLIIAREAVDPETVRRIRVVKQHTERAVVSAVTRAPDIDPLAAQIAVKGNGQLL